MTSLGKLHIGSEKTWSRIASIIVAAMGCLVLLGWMLDIPFLKSLLPGLATMKANTALCFALTGVSLWLLNDEREDQRTRRIALICALVVLLIGLLTLVEYLLGWDFGIDQLLFKDTASGTTTAIPGRMAQATALSFVMLGTALWLLGNSQRFVLTQLNALIVMGIALLALTGYLYGVASLYGVLAFTSIAFHSALAFLIVSMGILLARPDRGLIAVLTSNGPGGIMARGLLPAAILIPLLFGWLRLKGQQLGLYGTEFGLALFALSNIITFACLVWWNARSLNRADAQRKQAETAVKRYAERLEILHEIDLGILRGGSILSLVETTLKHIRQIIPCQRARLAIIDETTNEALVFELDFDGDTAFGPEIRIPLPPDFQAGFDTRNMQIIDDIRPMQDVNPRLKQLVSDGLLSLMGVLLIAEDRLIGSLGLLASAPAFFTTEYQEIVAEITNQLALAIRQLRLTEEIQQRTTELEQNNADLRRAEAAVKRYVQRMEILHQIDLGLIQGGSTQVLVEVVLKHIRQLIPCQRVSVSLLDETTGELLVFAVDLSRPSVVGTGIRVTPPSGWLDEYDTDHAKIIDDLRLQEDLIPAQRQLLTEGLVTFLHVLLTVQGQAIGLLALSTETPGFFNAEYREIAIEIANQLAIAIHQLHLTEELARHRDHLAQLVEERTAELQSAKERVEAILDNSGDGILLVHPDFTIQQTNPAFTKLFACETDDYLKQPLTALFHVEADDLITKTILADVAKGKALNLDVRARRKDLTDFDAELSVGFIKEGGFVCTIRDVTERKARERQLRLYASLQESVNDAVMTMDMQNLIQSWNRAAERIYGWTAEEVVGRNAINEVLHAPAGTEAEREGILQALQESGSWRGEMRRLRKDGTELDILASTTLLKDERGIPFGVVAVHHDITERKAQERQLRYLASLQENVSEAVISTDTEFRIQAWNRAAETIYGWRAEEVIGRTAVEVLQTRYESVQEQERVRQEFLKQGYGYGEFVQQRKDGTEVHILGSTTLFKDERGVPFGVVSVNHDISERKQAEEALRESQEKFRLLLDAAPVATVISDQMGRISLVNVQTESLFGYNRADLVGQMVEILVPEYAREIHIHNRAAYLAAPQMRQMGQGLELFARRKDGTEFPVEIELSYIDTTDGIMVMSFVVDVTERKHVAAELEQQRIFLRTVIDLSPSTIFVKDYDARFVLANRLAAQLYNTTVDDIIGKTDADLNPSSKEIQDFLAADRRVISSGESLFLEEPITNFNGETRWLQTSKVPIVGMDGESTYVLGVSTDITERKRADDALREQHEFLQLVINNLPELITVKDRAGHYQLVNKREAEVHGSTPTAMLGKMNADFNPNSAEVAFFVQKDRETLETGQTIFIPEETVFGRYYQTTKIPLKNQDGEFDRLLVVASDITERKHAEDTLRQAFEKEREFGELKSRFVSMASHEFRTPLATILAITETLTAYRSKLSDDKIDQRLDKIREQVNHLKDIMDDVLQLARMQARRVEFNPVRFDLDGLCRSVLDEFQSRPDGAHQFLYQCDASLHEVMLDKKLMRQIVSNLVANAVKYSPVGKPIAVNLEREGGTLRLSIRDEGIGIPEEDLKHLFEPFHRASNVGTIAGTGLGLTIIKEAIELHGGTIAVESRVGVGTTFTVTIPLTAERGRDDDENPGD